MTMEQLYKNHLEHLIKEAKEILEKESAEVAVIHAGSPVFYHADDQEIPFRAHAHFKRFTPVSGPNHYIMVSTARPSALLIEYRPDDFWEEQTDDSAPFWRKHLESHIVTNEEELKRAVVGETMKKSCVLISDAASSALVASWGVTLVDARRATTILDFSRAIKTPYEVACIEKANEIAARGHKAACEAFLGGASERDLYYHYLKTVGALENELPYETIIALNEKASTLHYRRKREGVKNALVLLLDAGYAVNGYASDITRTTANSHVHPLFKKLLDDVETLQQKLCALVAPGKQFIEIHHEAHRGIAEILSRHGISKTTPEELVEKEITHTFFPHGVGHMLGLQVHDVGNATPDGEVHELKKHYPKVRTNRALVEGMVTTIEPGLYFNPLLLEKLRVSDHSPLINWSLVDELTPYGGIRIEDNLVVTKGGSQNLTRTHLPT
ncbi:MAG: Xaa-Pro dipeptidase [Patescibacteria group bacterium]